MVKLSDGWAHKECSDENLRVVMEKCADPTINRPIEQCRWICGQCRQVVRSVFHVTENGTRICAKCSVGLPKCRGAEQVVAAEAALDAQ
jgi:hypothetical protein